MTPLLGFCPDCDPSTAGVITDCTNLIPGEKAMQGGPSPVAPLGVPALAFECRGAAVLTNLGGTRRVLAGAQTKLYELSGSTWTDVSRVGNYTGSTENRWSFAQFGNASIATNDTETIQASTSGAFADIAGAPKARIVIAVAGFVIAFNTNDATYGDSPDRWWNCALNDHTSWAASVTTQANSGRLVGAGGEITAASQLGSNAVAFKARAMFLGTYVGSPVVWQWEQVPGEVGCVGPEAVCDLGGALFFVGEDGFYLYDGTRPVPIGDGQVREWFQRDASQVYRYRTQAIFDRQTNRVWVFYPSRASSGPCDRALVYHLQTKQWGRADRQIQAVLNYVSPGQTFDSIGTVYSTWDDLPNIPYDSQFWQAGGRVFSVFDTANQMQNLIGASVSSGFVTGDIGDDDAQSLLRRVRLRFLDTPDSATVQGFTKQSAGDAVMPGASGSLSDGKFDLLQSARWHRLSFSFTGPTEVNAIRVDVKQAGMR